MKSTRKGLLLVIISGIVFGIMPSAVAFCCARGANQFLFLLFRYAVLAAILFPIVGTQKNTWALYRKSLPKLFVVSLAGVCTPLLLYTAYRYLPTGIVTTIHFLHPTLVALICVLVFHEKLSRHKLLCLILCVSGMILMLNPSRQGIDPVGIIIAAASGITWAIYIVLLDKLDFQEADSVRIMFCVSINGVVLALLAALVTGSFAVQMSASGWLALIGANAVIAIGGVLFFAIGVRRTGAQAASIASTLEPITSLVIGVLLLHEEITLPAAIGAVLILAAVIILSLFSETK